MGGETLLPPGGGGGGDASLGAPLPTAMRSPELRTELSSGRRRIRTSLRRGTKSAAAARGGQGGRGSGQAPLGRRGGARTMALRQLAEGADHRVRRQRPRVDVLQQLLHNHLWVRGADSHHGVAGRIAPGDAILGGQGSGSASGGRRRLAAHWRRGPTLLCTVLEVSSLATTATSSCAWPWASSPPICRASCSSARSTWIRCSSAPFCGCRQRKMSPASRAAGWGLRGAAAAAERRQMASGGTDLALLQVSCDVGAHHVRAGTARVAEGESRREADALVGIGSRGDEVAHHVLRRGPRPRRHAGPRAEGTRSQQPTSMVA